MKNFLSKTWNILKLIFQDLETVFMVLAGIVAVYLFLGVVFATSDSIAKDMVLFMICIACMMAVLILNNTIKLLKTFDKKEEEKEQEGVEDVNRNNK